MDGAMHRGRSMLCKRNLHRFFASLPAMRRVSRQLPCGFPYGRRIARSAGIRDWRIWSVGDALEITSSRPSWRDLVADIQHAEAMPFLESMDPSTPLWLPEHLERKILFLGFYKRVKRLHPEKIIFLRVGDVYEVVGIDAIMLISFAGMSKSGTDRIPRVRCPAKDIDHYLKIILHGCGFDVVICEETDRMMKIGKQKISKEHYVADVLTPGSGRYLHSLPPEEALALDPEFDRIYPMAAVYWSQTGFALIRYFSDEKRIKLTSRMSEEGLWAKLNASGMTPPLYLHESTLPGTRLDTTFRSWEAKAKEIASSIFGSIVRYKSADPLTGFKVLLQSKYPKLEVDAVALMKDDVGNRTMPPPMSTVTEIGIRPKSHGGVVPLMDAMMPKGSTQLAIGWMKRTIAEPPPPEIATEILKMCRGLSETESSIPMLNARLPPNRIVEVYRQSAKN